MRSLLVVFFFLHLRVQTVLGALASHMMLEDSSLFFFSSGRFFFFVDGDIFGSSQMLYT